MKKFSKILILLLSLVAIITAFTVVALATEEETTLSTPESKKTGGSWDDAKYQQGISVGSYTRYGHIYTEVSDNQNKYIVWMPSPRKGASTTDTTYYGEALSLMYSWNGTKTYTDNTDPENPTEVTVKTNKYNPIDYPYMVYEFDMMTPTGKFGGFEDPTFRTHVNNVDTKNTSLVIDTDAVIKKLDTTPFNWQHVTLIAKYNAESNVDKNTGLTVDALYDVYVYVDGVYLMTLGNAAGSTPKGKIIGVVPESIAYTFIRQSATKVSSEKGAPSIEWGSDPSTWYDTKTAFDNPVISYYKADWDQESIAADRWAIAKDLVPTGNKSVASVVKADGTYVYYGNLQDAINAAEEGETVKILEDVTDIIVVDKAITVDAGMYFGTAVSSVTLVGTREFPHVTREGFFAEAADGIYTFSEQDAYTVNWDPDCEGDCTCNEHVKHLYKDTTMALAGAAPTVPFMADKFVFEIENGLEIIFEGWSTEKGGEVIDLASFSAEAGATVNLYPVYTITQYSVEVISADASTYYLEAEFADAVAAAASGSTLKLHTDVYTECETILLYKSLTFDLNGYTLLRCFINGDVYAATEGENGELVYDETTVQETIAAQNSMFNIKASSLSIKITSSKDGGAFYNANMKAKIWKLGDVEVKREQQSYSSGYFVYSSYSGGGAKIDFTAENGVSIFSGALFYQDHATHDGNKITFNNATFNQFRFGQASVAIQALTNLTFTFTATDSTFYLNSESSFMRLGTKNGKGQGEGSVAAITMTNCDLFNYNSAYSTEINSYREVVAPTILLDNCRLYDFNSNVSYEAINGCLGASGSDSGQGITTFKAHSEGYALKETSITYKYAVPSIGLGVDSSTDIQKAKLNQGSTKTIVYNRILTKLATVNLVAPDGTTTTQQFYPGADTLAAPDVEGIEVDTYRDIAYVWADAATDGKAFEDYIGITDNVLDFKDEYTFYAVSEINGESKYVANIKYPMISLSYLGQLWLRLYIPVMEDVAAPTVSSMLADGKVLIDSEWYYSYLIYSSTTDIFNDLTVTVSFTVDEADYNQSFVISGLIYAEQIIGNDYYEAEQESVANLVRYVREAYELKAATNSTVAANLAKYADRMNALIGTKNADGSTTGGLYNLPAYATEYDTVESNIEDYSEYIKSVTIGLFGSSVRTYITLEDEAVLAGVKITKLSASGVSSDVRYDEATKSYYDANQRVYNGVGTIEITLFVPEVKDAETGDVITPASTNVITYSIANYIMAVTEQSPEENIDAAKAIYAFGIAAKAYRDNLTDY